MDVITMPSTTTLLSRLKTYYPQFFFKLGDDFSWSASDNTIYYNNKIDDQPVFLLHELSHALLGHASYTSDIQLITMERQAWDHTMKLASKYNVTISDDMVQSNLDSYRDWLHSRSTCPKCQATGLQTKEYTYKCPACSNEWQVNEARICALRRYKLKK
jgi:Zn finger protein HypA/HybF involved in hydrogenase expression